MKNTTTESSSHDKQTAINHGISVLNCHDVIFGYDCGCIICGSFRISELLPGDLVRPYCLEPNRYASSVTEIHAWVGSEPTFNSMHILITDLVIFLGLVPKEHSSYYLNGCYVLVPGINPRLLLTSANWLRKVKGIYL